MVLYQVPPRGHVAIPEDIFYCYNNGGRGTPPAHSRQNICIFVKTQSKLKYKLYKFGVMFKIPLICKSSILM
jgi:hypothetical protein